MNRLNATIVKEKFNFINHILCESKKPNSNAKVFFACHEK